MLTFQRALLLFGLAAPASVSACEAVPDLRFVGPDAGALEAGADAGTSPVADASPSDARGDASPTCANPPPDGATKCCGTVWCIGLCETQNCDLCANKGCPVDEVCCGKTGTVQCKPKCP